MRTNPGGHISPEETLGRDKLILKLWRILKRQSLILSAERRIGKTSVIKKMVAEAPADVLPIYHDLEGIRTPLEFVETIFHDVENYLGRLNRTAGRVRKFLAQFIHSEFNGYGVRLPEIAAPHWRALLTKTIEDLVEHQQEEVIFFWDELPLMLHNIKNYSSENEGEKAAMEVLDALRSLRQMFSRLRLVYTGSIGIHNVIHSLKKSGYANDPTNDMYIEVVPPLSEEDAKQLALRLIIGEKLSSNDANATSKRIAQAAGGQPFFIHHIIDQMVQRDETANEEDVAIILNETYTNPQDPWHLRYYYERLEIYYTPEEHKIALVLLDILSVAKSSLSFNETYNLLKAQIPTEDIEIVRTVLTLLQRDYYFKQDPNGTVSFRFPIIQQYWRITRGLNS